MTSNKQFILCVNIFMYIMSQQQGGNITATALAFGGYIRDPRATVYCTTMAI